MATHERKHLDRALDVLEKVGRELGVLSGSEQIEVGRHSDDHRWRERAA